jgi:hypothetical protein
MDIQQFATALYTGITLQNFQNQVQSLQKQIDALNALTIPAITEG